ncbi:hypothetical protein AAZX31_14G159300 [Glycine max]
MGKMSQIGIKFAETMFKEVSINFYTEENIRDLGKKKKKEKKRNKSDRGRVWNVAARDKYFNCGECGY